MQSSLGRLYRSQGSLEDSRKAFDKAHDNVISSQGQWSWERSQLLHSMAKLAETRGDSNSAMAFHKELNARFSAEARRGHGGGQLRPLRSMARIAEAQGDSRRAVQLLGKMLEIEKQYSNGDVRRLSEVSKLHTRISKLQLSRGEMRSAAIHAARAHQTALNTYGGKHLESALTLLDLARVLKKHGKLAEAETLLRRCVVLWTQLKGRGHMDTVRRIKKLARTLELTGRFREALVLYEEACDLLSNKLGSRHLLTLHCIGSKGRNKKYLGDYSGAMAEYNEVVSGYTHLLGGEHHDLHFWGHKVHCCPTCVSFWLSGSEGAKPATCPVVLLSSHSLPRPLLTQVKQIQALQDRRNERARLIGASPNHPRNEPNNSVPSAKFSVHRANSDDPERGKAVSLGPGKDGQEEHPSARLEREGDDARSQGLLRLAASIYGKVARQLAEDDTASQSREAENDAALHKVQA